MRTLQARLRERGVKQSDVAARLGVSEATVSKWLCRKQAIPTQAVLPLAELLAMDAADVLRAIQAAPPAKATEIAEHGDAPAQVA